MQMTNPGLRLIQEGKSEKRDFILFYFFLLMNMMEGEKQLSNPKSELN